MPKSTHTKRSEASLTLVFDDGTADVYSGSVVELRSLLLDACADPEIVACLERYTLYDAGRLVDSATLAAGSRLAPAVRAWRSE